MDWKKKDIWAGGELHQRSDRYDDQEMKRRHDQSKKKVRNTSDLSDALEEQR
jgi:hypothetical protein